MKRNEMKGENEMEELVVHGSEWVEEYRGHWIEKGEYRNGQTALYSVHFLEGDWLHETIEAIRKVIDDYEDFKKFPDPSTYKLHPSSFDGFFPIFQIIK